MEQFGDGDGDGDDLHLLPPFVFLASLLEIGSKEQCVFGIGQKI